MSIWKGNCSQVARISCSLQPTGIEAKNKCLAAFFLTHGEIEGAILVLARIELIFFIVVCTVLCFGFIMKTVLMITQRCFSYCWAVLTQSEGLFCFSPYSTSEEAGGGQEAGRGHSQDSWPQLTKGIFQTIGCHAQHIKLGAEVGRGGCSEWWRLPSQVTVRRDGALLSWRWLNTCLPMGSGEWIPCFASLVCVTFAVPIKLSLSQPTSFLIFTLPIFSPIPLGGVSEWLCGA